MSALAEGAPSTLLVSWRKLRHLLPVYTAIASSFNFSPPPCSDLSEVEMDDAEAVLHIARWIDGIDAVSQAQHLRTVLQDLDVCSSDMCVHTWLQHFISKPARTAADRDKIDFLLSHYLRVNLPPSLQEGKPNYSAMKAVLEPVLGGCGAELPEEARELEELVGIAERCRTLAEFERSGVIRRGRELKLRAGDLYFTPPFLLCFTHFNAVVRRECTRLMNSDLKFAGEALERLEQRGITHIDCTAANWSDHEPVDELKNKWATWEVLENDYSKDFFANLIGFRSVLEEALARSIELSMTSVSQELRSIHALLLEMRAEIDDLPNKLEKRNVGECVPAKPLLVFPATGKAAQIAANEQGSPSLQRAATALNSIPISTSPDGPEFVKPTSARTLPKTSEAARVEIPQPHTNYPGTSPPAIAIDPVSDADLKSTPVPETPVPATARAAVSGSAGTKQTAALSASIETTTALASEGAGVQQGGERNPTTPQAVTNAPGATPGAIDLEAGIARLQKTLSGKRPSAVSIAVAGTRILLTGTEASMFSVANDRFAHAVQRAVMMRICVVSALETHSNTRDKSPVAALVPAARAEYSAIRELISEAKAQKLAREEDILSATAKQLSAMVERAERVAR
jgi:hypothetical protein